MNQMPRTPFDKLPASGGERGIGIFKNHHHNTASIDSSNKSNGASIGVSFGANGFTLNLSANGGKGVANGDETTYSETTIGSTGSTTTLNSGGDTTLDGTIVQGKHVKADVGGNLTINTPQDVSHYDSKQTSYGVGVSIPLGAGAFGVSGSFSSDKANANTNTTQEIAGIYAGEGGYDIQVKGNTTLDAGVIASTASPDNNQLTTSTLVLKDKANQSAYDADSVGLSASYTSDSSKGLNGWNASPPSAMGASDDASSTTRAAISAGNIRITNDAAQQQLTGQTAEQTLASINHDTANNATLANLYEQDKESIQTGFAIGRGLSQNFATFMNDMAKDMDSVAKSPAVDKEGKPIIGADGKQLTNQEAYQAGLELGDTVNAAGESINYGTRQDLWGSGGTGNRIATALIGAYSGNVSNGASTLLQNTALNVVRTYGATEIKYLADSFSETDEKGNPIPNAISETVRGLLHAVAGCAGASATGGDCASAGLASAGTVAMNNAMTALLNLNPNEMTDTQKQAYANLIGTLVAGVSTAVGGDAAAAQLASKVEVDGNYLDPIQRTWGFDVVNNQLAHLQGHNLTREQYEAQLLKLTPTSEKMNEKMIADCLGGKASCTKEKADAQDYINWIKAMEAQGKLTPGKFGNGTLEALAQVATVTYNSPVAHQTATPTDVGVLGALMPAHLQGVAANSQVSQALGYQNSMNEVALPFSIAPGLPYVATAAGYGFVVATGELTVANAVGAGLGVVSNVGAQYAYNNTDNNKDGVVNWKDIDKTDALIGFLTGAVAVNYQLLGNVVTNEVGYVMSNALNGDLGNASWAGATATAAGTSLGYGAGRLAQYSLSPVVQWNPVTTPTLPLTPYGANVIRPPLINNSYTRTFNSPIPSVGGTFAAPFAQEFSTPLIQKYLLLPQNMGNKQ